MIYMINNIKYMYMGITFDKSVLKATCTQRPSVGEDRTTFVPLADLMSACTCERRPPDFKYNFRFFPDVCGC